MNEILKHIIEQIDFARNKPGFLDILFGKHKDNALRGGTPVVLFGAGGLGAELYSTLRRHGVCPVCFCDNDNSKGGGTYCGIPVITFKELKESFQDSLIVIASHKYHGPITKQLLESDFRQDRILCKISNAHASTVFMYSMSGTQRLFGGYKQLCHPTVLDVLLEHQESLKDAYDLLADQHSKDLFVSKFALMASDENFELFRAFIESYSQPVLEFGFGNYDGTPEDYYYFNNNVLSLSSGEVYVDVGAFDGDSVHTFVEACQRNQLNYKWIHAFEPDPHCYRALLKNTASYENISCRQTGLWWKSQTLRFNISENGIHDQASAIDDSGNIEIEGISLDDYLRGEAVSLIKMDPGGNIIPEVIRGASDTIARHKPKLVMGAYHSIKSMFEIPLLVNRICPDYKLFLRHNTYHLCDTDLYAVL